MVPKVTGARNLGFTLVEILIAMVILSLTLLTLFVSFNSILSSGSRVKADINNSKGVSPGMARIISDLEQIFITRPPRYQKPEFNSDPDPHRLLGKSSMMGEKQFSFLSFTSLNHAWINEKKDFPPDSPDPGNRFGTKGLTRITYYVHQHEGKFTLHRSDRPVLQDLEDQELSPCTDPALFQDITGFTLIYQDNKGEAHESWDSDSKDFSHGLPVRVVIRVETNVEEKSSSMVTALALPLTREVFQ